jgi:leucyl aminopeptidase
MQIKNIRKEIAGDEKLLIVPMFADAELKKTIPASLQAIIEPCMKSGDFTGKAFETLLLLPNRNEGHDQNIPSKILLVGFGAKSDINASQVRNCAGAAIKEAKKHNLNEVAVYIAPQLTKFAEVFAEGIGMGNYNPAAYQTGENKEKNEKSDVKEITIIMDAQSGSAKTVAAVKGGTKASASAKAQSKITAQAGAALKKDLETGLLIAAAVNEVRDLVNAPAPLKNISYLVDRAKEIAHASGSHIKILDKKELARLGMGAIIGVNKGSSESAKMVVMEHKPFGSKKEPIVIIGKGIIFDSGGYNLKPRDAMTDMKSDMAGAAAVMGVFRLLKDLAIRQHVVGIFPLTENLIGSEAQKPSDIITTFDGKTVEVTNTDAEGRLVLADAIGYAVKNCNPRYIIDLATLTGACVIALGEKYAGLFGNDDELISKLKKAGDAVDELVWPLPIHSADAEKMKGIITDYRNWEPDISAALSKSAAFIRFFVGEKKWAHLDIAGPAFVKTPKKYESQMATGYGVRLLVEFLQKA